MCRACEFVQLLQKISLSKREVGYHTNWQANNQYGGGTRKTLLCSRLEAAVGEVLICEREPDNASGRCALGSGRPSLTEK